MNLPLLTAPLGLGRFSNPWGAHPKGDCEEGWRLKSYIDSFLKYISEC